MLETSGSIEAATSDATSIGIGFAGAIIEKTRIRMAFHETTGPSGSFPPIAIVLSKATPTALATMNSRPAVLLARSEYFERRKYTCMAADRHMPQISILTAKAGWL